MTNTFDHIILNKEQIRCVENLRNHFASLLIAVEEYVPAGRDRAVVITKLEEAAMWSNKGISRGSPQ